MELAQMRIRQSCPYLAVALLVLVGLLRISSTYNVFWQSWDAPAHIARGMEWIGRGKYTYSIDKRPHTSIDRIVGTKGLLHDAAYFMAENVPLRAPEFFSGIREVAQHNKYGHVAYLLGEAYTEGRWYFFPIINPGKVIIG